MHFVRGQHRIARLSRCSPTHIDSGSPPPRSARRHWGNLLIFPRYDVSGSPGSPLLTAWISLMIGGTNATASYSKSPVATVHRPRSTLIADSTFLHRLDCRAFLPYAECLTLHNPKMFHQSCENLRDHATNFACSVLPLPIQRFLKINPAVNPVVAGHSGAFYLITYRDGGAMWDEPQTSSSCKRKAP